MLKIFRGVKTLWLADWLVVLLTVVGGLAVGWAIVTDDWVMLAIEFITWAIGTVIYIEYRGATHG